MKTGKWTINLTTNEEKITATITNLETGNSRQYVERVADFVPFYLQSPSKLGPRTEEEARWMAWNEAAGTAITSVRDHFDKV